MRENNPITVLVVAGESLIIEEIADGIPVDNFVVKSVSENINEIQDIAGEGGPCILAVHVSLPRSEEWRSILHAMMHENGVPVLFIGDSPHDDVPASMAFDGLSGFVSRPVDRVELGHVLRRITRGPGLHRTEPETDAVLDHAGTGKDNGGNYPCDENDNIGREQFRLLFDGSHNVISVVDEEGILRMINENGARNLGKEKSVLIGRPISEFFPDRHETVMKFIRRCLDSGEDIELEDSFELPRGNRHYISYLQPLQYRFGDRRAALITSHDITHRKRIENSLAESLREKELLLREIHHRVKNNMQIISSLLDLQYHRVVNITDRQLFLDSQNRVRALALVHEKLYQSDSMTRIDFENYIFGLIREYNDTLNSMTGNITIDVRVKDVYMEINEAIPCALIVNELVTNSLKHAFPGGRRGRIGIDFTINEEGIYYLVVEDDGVGIPRSFDIRNTDSLGMQLIHALTHQLKGNISHESGPGTRFTLSFGKKGKHEIRELHSGENEEDVHSRNVNILIVEDERITAMHLSGILIKAGYTVAGIVSRGRDVVDAVKKEKPHLVLMDIILEDDMDGIEAVKEMRRGSSVPVIFITANTDNQVLQRAMKVNPSGYLIKPIDKVDLINSVEKVMTEEAPEDGFLKAL